MPDISPYCQVGQDNDDAGYEETNTEVEQVGINYVSIGLVNQATFSTSAIISKVTHNLLMNKFQHSGQWKYGTVDATYIK